MRIRPLTGQVLVEVESSATRSTGGIILSDRPLSAEQVQEASRDPQKPVAMAGVVRAIGPWPKLRNGMVLMPEFGVGARVLLNPWRGQEMRRGLGERLRLVRSEDVLAILS